MHPSLTHSSDTTTLSAINEISTANENHEYGHNQGCPVRSSKNLI